MKKTLPYFLVYLFFLFFQTLSAQNKKPKVAVVLSGGGAKGVAHIPLLQTLDSLGIVPDLIIGTSMGSVVGGFYAMGYSGDSIASITENAKWDELLGGKLSLKDVSIEEKGEFNKYLINLDWVKGKPKTTSSLLNDQYLREFLSIYTYPVYNIHDFDSLPIPYRAMTTDIVNGEEVLLKNGSLSMAMRASMSIPSIFKPVSYKDVLLVDGGVLNNFPADVAKSMGADIIIGSDVGDGMKPKEELEGISTILFQTAMLTSNVKNPANRKLCDILLDHLPNLTYSTADFGKSKEIYEEGKIATLENKDKLVSLAKMLKEYPQKIPEQASFKKKFTLDTIIFNEISDDNIELVKSRSNILEHKEYNAQEIIDGVNRAMGTNIFNQITYNSVKDNGKLGLEINGFEKSQHQIKASLHYDTYRSIGLILNYTGRNIIGKSSRFLISLDIAEQPRFRAQYQKQMGERKNFWWSSEVFGEHLEQEVFLNGDFAEDIKFRYFQFVNEINKNLNSFNSYLGIGLNYENTDLKPKADSEVVENVFNLKNYTFNNFEVSGHYVFNTKDAVFYASKGTYLKAKIARSFFHEVDLEYADEAQTRIKGTTNGFTKLSLVFEKRIALKKKIVGIVATTSNFIFEETQESDDVSFTGYGYGAKYYLGGNLLNPRTSSYSFYGLHEDELNVSQFMKLLLAVQFNPINKIYLTPHFNIASVGFEDFEDYIDDAFSPKGNWAEMLETSSLISAGATASYHSYLGPVNFDVSWVNDIDKIRVFFSVGLHFNMSN